MTLNKESDDEFVVVSGLDAAEVAPQATEAAATAEASSTAAGNVEEAQNTQNTQDAQDAVLIDAVAVDGATASDRVAASEHIVDADDRDIRNAAERNADVLVETPQPPDATAAMPAAAAGASNADTVVEDVITAAAAAITDPAQMIGAHVKTDFGYGKVVNYRSTDQTYFVALDHGMNGNCAPPDDRAQESPSPAPPVAAAAATSAAPAKPQIIYTKHVVPLTTQEKAEMAKNSTMDLNIAYQSLEKMRKLNLELECSEAGVFQVDHEACSACQIQKTHQSNYFPRLQQFMDTNKAEETTQFPRLQKLWASTKVAKQQAKEPEPRIVLPRIQKLIKDRKQSTTEPCLICASPCCSNHSSSIFRKEGITLCTTCERCFELDFIIDCVSTADPVERAKHIDRMVDLYDRSLLLLKYSSQYIEPIARGLESRKEQQNKIGLGSSSVGIVSGVLGVAAAATILTPAGPPLLIASLFFGGSATAVQTGSEAMNYFSEPRKLADRIIALHGMLRSILRVTSTLRDAMLRHHIRTDAYAAEGGNGEHLTAEEMQKAIEKNKAGVLAGANVGRSLTLGTAAATGSTVVTAEAGVVGARASTALSRAGTAAARTIRFARFAGGALSAAVLVMEANAIHATVKSIQAGNPCDKAEAIRKILKEIENREVPSTSDLDEECQAYLSALEGRSQPPFEPPATASTAVPVAEPVGEAIVNEIEPEILVSVATVTTSTEDLALEEEEENGQQTPPAPSQPQPSLLERIRLHQTRGVAAEAFGENERSGDGRTTTSSAALDLTT